MKLSIDTVNKTLAAHYIEVWNGYAVGEYSGLHQNGMFFNGEDFTPLSDLQDSKALENWLGY